MKKAGCQLEINKVCPKTRFLNEMLRQALINKIALSILSECRAEEEAIGMFFWKTADLNPPVNHKEQRLFYALYLMYQSSHNMKIDSKEKALEILRVLEEKLALPKNDLIKEIKLVYWHYFCCSSHNLGEFVNNAREIGIKKSAFDFLCHL